MNKKQAAALSTLAYLDMPDDDDIVTLGEFVEYFTKHPDKLPKDEEKRKEVLDAIEIVKSDTYLENLEIVGYTNNNEQGTKSGFVGYAFAEATSSEDGVVAFRGSETPITENWNDWLNNVAMETGPSSKQMEDAITFMNNTKEKEGAGNLKNIEVTGHSLGGFLAASQAILDPRVTSATTFNAPGVPNSFIKKNLIPILNNKNKINAYTASGDLVSKIGSPLDFPEVASGSFNMVDAHSMANFLEGDENMEDLGFMEELHEILPEKLADLIDSLAIPIDEKCPGLIEKVTTYFSELPGNIGGFFNQITTDTSTWGSNLITKAQENIPLFIESVNIPFSELPGNVGGFFDQITTGLSTWTSDMTTRSEKEMPSFIESVKTYFSELPGNVGEFFNQISTDLSTWTSDMIIKNEEEMPSFIESFKTYFSELPGNVGGFFDQITTGLSTWTSDMIFKSDEEMPSFISHITNSFSGLPGNMSPIGGDMVKGLFNGISNSVQWLYGKLKGWVSSVISYIKNLFGIHSPSAIMRDEVGKNLALGVADGISKNINAVSDAMAEMTDTVSGTSISVEPEVKTGALDFDSFKEKIRPSLDFVKMQIARARETLNTQFAASMQLAGVMAGAGANNTYNNGNTFNNHYTITAANYSPKATADAIKNQMTMQRMLFATR